METTSDSTGVGRLVDRVSARGFSWGLWLASLGAMLAIPPALMFLIVRRVPGCPNIETASSFSSDPLRFVDYITSHQSGPTGCTLTSLGRLHRDLAVGYIVAVAYLLVFVVVWMIWWRRAWLTKWSMAARRMIWLAPVAAIADIVENVVQHASIGLSTSPDTLGVPRVGWFATRVLPIVAWVKVLAFIGVWLAVVFTLMAALSRRRIDGSLREGVLRTASRPQGLGICCSGGGIRAASISLGALGILERTRPDGRPVDRCSGTEGVLDRASFLASVSGGGYAAGAWRIARGTRASAASPEEFEQLWPLGIVGSPDYYDAAPRTAFDDIEPPGGQPSLFRHVQQRREFLRTGRGGLSASLIGAVAFLAAHLVLLVALLVAVAWPVGRLARTSYVYGGIGCRMPEIHLDSGLDVVAPDIVARHGDLPASLCEQNKGTNGDDPLMRFSPTRSRVFVSEPGVQFPVSWRLYGPAAVFTTMASALFIVSLVQWNTLRRARLRAVAAALAGAGVLSGLLLVGVPVWLDVAHPWLSDHSSLGTLLAITSSGGAVASSIGAVRKVVGPRIAMLGGVLLAAAALLLGTEVAAQAAMGRAVPVVGLLGQDWLGWLALCGVLALAYALLCPRWWSLHTLYRNRLRAAFATTRRLGSAPRRLRRAGEGSSTPMLPMRQQGEPLLSHYRGAPGPTHLICCSAARQHRTATGVKALSFVMGPDEVVFYDIEPATGATTGATAGEGSALRGSTPGWSLPVKAYGTSTAAWLRALGPMCTRRAEGTVAAGMSVSGAAIAPAMGRMDKGSTMALLAALNLRLGTWYPNPRYVQPSRTRSAGYPWVRLSYVLKELLGLYDLRDHHLYVTDGGHRENLGLVELLRRRCRTIICVDSSGDTPGSYTTLRQAVDLARVEVGATVDLGPLRAQGVAFDSAPDAAPWAAAGTEGSLRVTPPRMNAVDAERPPSAHTILTVTYRDPQGEIEGEGQIIHIAAVMYEALPVELVAFGLEDAHFPHYSTGDQFLSEKQFRSLVQFGQAATACALADEAVVEAIQSAVGAPPVPPGDVAAPVGRPATPSAESSPAEASVPQLV